jgi:hypothetical protein
MAVAAPRQTRRRKQNGSGRGVDSSGGPVIDPTENVLALVQVEKEHAQELRAADQRLNEELRQADYRLNRAVFEGEVRYQDGMRNAESRRQNDIITLKQTYDDKVSAILTAQVTTTSDLISTQLDKVTDNLSKQISAAADQARTLMGTLSDRIGTLEQSRWEVAGRASVQDPATAAALKKLNSTINGLGTSRDEGRGATVGADRMWVVVAIVIAGIAAAAALYPHISPGRLEPVYQAPPAYSQPPTK